MDGENDSALISEPALRKESTPDRERTRNRVRSSLLIFLLSAILSMGLLRPPPPPPVLLQGKLDALAQMEQVDLIFLGSSRTHFQFMPSAFDAEVERHGVEITSFNLGLFGAEGHEIDYVLDHFVLPMPNLRYVFIEFPRFEYQTADVHEGTFRKIYWHDLRRTIDAVETSLQGPLPLGLRINEMEDHLLHFLLRYSALWPPDPRKSSLSTDEGGYVPWGREDAAAVEDQVGRGLKPGPGRGEDWISERTIRRQLDLLRERNIEVYYVLPPGSPQCRPLMEMEERGEIPPVLVLNDPREFPEFFTAEVNVGYLRRQGAELYSQTLGGEFCRLLESPKEG